MKLVSLNLERSRHLGRAVPFLKGENADVVCVQELMERDIALFEAELGAKCIFSPSRMHAEEDSGVEGIAILSRHAPRSREEKFYVGDSRITNFDTTNLQTRHDSENRKVLSGVFEIEGADYTIATTHFTWTPNGLPDAFQRQDIVALLNVLAKMKAFVLCGDFNAPRLIDGKPGEIFSMLGERYRDNIPTQYETSIDVNLHRAGHKKEEHMDLKMVDGLFTTPEYKASNVRLQFGVSDHAAIVADISSE